MRMVILALILLISPASALTLNGHIQMLKRIDIFLGHESGFMSYNLTNENYTICISDGRHYHIKPDESGNFSVELLKGTYRIWVNITLQDKNTSVVANIPYLYFYPAKIRPITVNLTNDSHITIEPNKVRWYPPEPIMPNTRLRIVGHVYNPEHANLTVKLYMTNKSIYCLKTEVKNETFEFKNVLPVKNYTIEIIPNEISLNNGSKIIYKKAYINFKPYATPKRMIINISVDIPYELIKSNTSKSRNIPSFKIATALLAIFIALRKTNLR